MEEIFKKRDKNCNKYDFGTLLLIAGSFGMCGAEILAAKSAMRSGVGLVRAVVCDKNYAPFCASVPEAVCSIVPTGSDGSPIINQGKFYELMSDVNCITIGCGLGVTESTISCVECVVKHSTVPIVADADALNIISKNPDILFSGKADILLTPHMGEFSRLMGIKSDILNNNPVFYAEKFAKKYGITLLLKGHKTIITDGNTTICENFGSPALATPGSGDVLAGIIGALMAQGNSAFDSAYKGAYLHGLKGKKAEQIYGEWGVIASDLIC